jgi:2-polyprenyl-3-methyl-5-hydroxy-6-metoxy-1,4-benzoquinol methylase
VSSVQTRHKLPKVPLVGDRHLFVIERCKGKRVLHIGCTDEGMLGERFERGNLLHARLEDVADLLWGVDIDREGIEFLCGKGFGNLLVADAEKIDECRELAGRDFEVIIAAEIIEHLSNPGLFLDSVKNLMTPEQTELVISVPNAFRPATLKGLAFGYEEVHPDHNYWFSYKTITNLLQRHGYSVEQLAVYTSLPIAGKLPGRSEQHGSWWTKLKSLPKSLVARAMFATSSFWGDGIIVVARLADESESSAD